ncbi:CAAX protease family protein [Acidiphilium sp. MT5]
MSPWSSTPDRITRQPLGARPFGPRQGWVLMIGFFLVQLLVGIVAILARGFIFGIMIGVHRGLQAAANHQTINPFHLGNALMPPPPDAQFITALGIGAYVIAAIWSAKYITDRVGPRLYEASSTGVAWCAAQARFYGVAVLLALVIVAVATGLTVLFPFAQYGDGHLGALKQMLAPGWPRVASLILFILIAPPAEEFIFRGGAFAALASRHGVWVSGAIVTACFVALHAPEKIHYPPGFIDITLLAVAALWLRLRSGSLKPAMVLHVLYNGGVIVAAAIIGALRGHAPHL